MKSSDLVILCACTTVLKFYIFQFKFLNSIYKLLIAWQSGRKEGPVYHEELEFLNPFYL